MGIGDEIKGDFLQMLAALGAVGMLVLTFIALSTSILILVIPMVLIGAGMLWWKMRR